jgi:hypothetical protein
VVIDQLLAEKAFPHESVFGLIVGQGLKLGAFGVAAGFVIALFLSRWIRSLLVETKIVDPLTYVGITIIFCIVVSFA